MSQVQAKKKADLYYRMPKKSYEQLNKKWVERKAVFETKKTFITGEDATWKNMSQTEKDLFMKSPPPAPSKNRIGFFSI